MLDGAQFFQTQNQVFEKRYDSYIVQLTLLQSVQFSDF